jgi:hypothetical protein
MSGPYVNMEGFLDHVWSLSRAILVSMCYPMDGGLP